MKGLQTAITVVGFLLLLGLSYPMIAFISDVKDGNSGVYIRYEGEDMVVDFVYRGKVELEGVKLTITFVGSKELTRSTEVERMVNGTHLSLMVPAREIPSNLRELRIGLRFSVGGIFPLTVSRTVEVARG